MPVSKTIARESPSASKENEILGCEIHWLMTLIFSPALKWFNNTIEKPKADKQKNKATNAKRHNKRH